MEAKYVKIKRLIPKGGINPNIGKPYFNLEEKIKEKFKLYEEQFCEIPVVVRCQEEIDSEFINPVNAIGFVTEISDTDATIKYYDDFFDDLDIDNFRLEINTLSNTEAIDNAIYVNRVIKFMISMNNTEG